MTLPVLAVALLLAGSPAKLEFLEATDLSSQPVTFRTAGHVTAVLFISAECPVSNAYNERMQALYRDYALRGVQFVFLNANSTEPAAAVASHARDKGFSFPVYKDEANMVADRLGAEFTPHVFVIGPDSQVLYRGGIDDSRQLERVTRNHLREALDAALAGKPVPTAEVKAFGCTIKRVKKTT